MTAQTFGEVRSAPRAQIRAVGEQIAPELMLPEALVACGTFCDGVLPAVPEEQYALFAAQITRPLAVEMDDNGSVEPNGIVL